MRPICTAVRGRRRPVAYNCVMTLRGNAFILVAALIALVLPLTLRAQAVSPSDTRAAIRAALIADPRTAGLTEAQLDMMVQILTRQAAGQGLTAEDIQWRPQDSIDAQGDAPAPACDGFLCTMTEAFGFLGGDATIPFFLGMSSMGLIWILAEMLHRHRHPHLYVPPQGTGTGPSL